MEKKLQRNEQEKMIAGVCAGLADYFDLDVTWIRIAFVIAFLAGFSGLLAYIILWIAVPVKPYVPGTFYQGPGRYDADYRVYEEKRGSGVHSAYTVPEPPQGTYKTRKNGNGRMIAGLLLVGFGAFFLLDEFNVIPYWFDFDKLWPLIFIIPGILIISKNSKRRVTTEENTIREEPNTATNSTDTVTTEEEPKL